MNGWRWLHVLVLVLVVAVLGACGGGEAKKNKFLAEGQAHYDAGDYIAARLDVKNALQIDPKFAEGYLLLGRAELKLKNFKGAYKAFSGAIKYDPENMDAQLELGRLLLAGRQFDKAIEKADLVLSRDDGQIGAKVLKASALLLMKKPSEAVELLEKTVRPDLKIPQAFSVLAMCYLQERQVEKGREVLLQGISANPESVPLRLLLARVEAGSKNLDAAVAQLQASIKLEPANKMLPFQLADLFWAFQRIDQAKALVREQVERQPGDEEAYLLAAQFFAGKNELQEAEGLLAKGIAGIPATFKLRFALSDVLVKEKKTDRALAVLKDALSLSKDPENPDIVTARVALSRLHLMMRDIQAARSEIDQVLSVSPKNTDGHFLLGQILIAEGKAADAVSEFRMVIGDRPDFMPAYLMLARTHLIEKQSELAMDVLGKALEVNPDATEILRAMAVLRTRNKDYAGAEANLRKILEKIPGDIRTRTQLGDLFFFTKDFEKAEREYDQLVREYGKSPLGYLRLSRLHAQRQQWDEAEKILRRGQSINPDEPALLVSLVQVLLKNNHVAAAETLCRAEISRRPDRGMGYTLLARVLIQQKQYTDAEAQLRKAIEVEPSWQLPYNVLAKLYVDQGREAEAIKELQALKSKDPENARTYFSLAMLYEKSGKDAQAIAIYRDLLAKQPNLWAASNNLAYLLSVKHSNPKELDEALVLVKNAIKLRPQDPTVLDTLGWVHHQRGEQDLALAALEEALEKNPDSAELNYHAAVVLHDAGRDEEAREKLAVVLRDDDFTDRAAAEKLNALIVDQKN